MIKQSLSWSAAILLLFLLSGCGSLPFSSKDTTQQPAKLVDFEPQATVERLWQRDIGAGDQERFKLEPKVYLDRLYVADTKGRVLALDAATGETVWQTETQAALSGGPGVGDRLVVLGTSNAQVIALAELDGQELWRVRVSSEVLSAPAIADGVVIVHTADGKLVGLDAETGEQKWLYERTIPLLTLRGNSAPLIDGYQVICGFAGGKLMAFELQKGQILWETTITPPVGRSDLEQIVDIDANLLLKDSVLYAATYQGELAAIAAETGITLWRQKLSVYAGLAIDWRAIYASDANDHLVGVDIGNGAVLWKQDKLQGRQLTGPAVVDDYLVVGDYQGYLHWFWHENGRLVARNRLGGAAITAQPLTDNGITYVYGSKGDLAAYRLIPIASDEPL